MTFDDYLKKERWSVARIAKELKNWNNKQSNKDA